MQYSFQSEALILQSPADSLDLTLALVASPEEIDDTTLDDLVQAVNLPEDVGRDAGGGTNYDLSSEFYPVQVSSEATDKLLTALGLTPFDFPDASTDVE